MREIVLYIAISLDGYVADSKGGVAWLNGDGSKPENMGTYGDLMNSIDTVVMGYSTYNQIITELSPDTWVYAGLQSYVFTHRDIESNSDEIVITSQPIEELLALLKQESGKNIWICGGASIANQVIKSGLVDRYHIAIIPTILGDGIRLFENYDSELQLKLVDTVKYNGIVECVYTPRK